MVLTRNAKHPEVVARWLDHFFQPFEGGLFCEYGLEGSGWERAKPGEVGLDGRPARWRPLRAWGTMQNIAWVHSVPFFNSAEKRNSQVAGPNDQETILYRETTRNYVPFASDRTVPPLFFTEAQALEMAQIEVNVKNHVDNSAARFIVGDLSLDRDWNTYVSDLERMGAKRYTEIHQQAYEAKYKR
jgi:putative aldouronate transport system substrate-binding protein